MSFDAAKWVWMNGRSVRWDEATVHVSAHGLHYGSGVFEGVRCYETEAGPALFRLDAHLERLYYSASVYGMEIPYTREALDEAVMRLARALGYEVETRALTTEDLRAADEVFFTGTAVEVTPVVELDGVSIGEGRRGPVTERIQRAFFDATSGRDPRYADWLRHVAAQPVGSY